MAAVLVAARNEKRNARKMSVYEEDELDLSALAMQQLPPENKRKFDFEVATLLNG